MPLSLGPLDIITYLFKFQLILRLWFYGFHHNMARKNSDYWPLTWRPSKNKREEELEKNEKISLLNIETVLFLFQLIFSLWKKVWQVITNKYKLK